MMIVKTGGGEAINLEGIVRDLAEVEEPFIIVHGANALRDQLAERLNRPKRVVTSVSGYSSVFSDGPAMDVQIMAYAGLRNKRLVELCRQAGINAVGLTGLDGGLVQGKRNRGIRVRENGKTLLIRDFSGKPQTLNRLLLDLLLDNGFAPVLSVPIVDETGTALNSENDDVVALLQAEFRAERVFQFIEAPGFLADPGDPASVLERLNPGDLEEWETRTEGRMKRKLLALRKLFAHGPAIVHIADGRVEHPIQNALAGGGTVIASAGNPAAGRRAA